MLREDIEKYAPIKLAYDLYKPATRSNSNLTPIILIHGLASDRTAWVDIAPVIAENTNRRVYAYDARNYGDSEYTDEFSFSLNIDDLFHFMNIVNVEKAVLIGHSMGAFTALNAALRKPERVEMVISEDTYLKPLTDQAINLCGEYVKELASSLSKIPGTVDEKEAIKIVTDEMFARLSEENRKYTPKDIMYKLHVPFKRGPDGRYSGKYNEKALYEASQQPRTMKVEPVGLYEGPAVFLCGTESIMNVMSHKSHIKGYFPNAEFIEFEGGYHSLHVAFEKEVADTIIKVLNKYDIA